MPIKNCFLIGHREASNMVFHPLVEAVKQHISEYGVTEFVVGCYGNFDQLAAEAVRQAQKTYPQVTLIRLLPYYPTDCQLQALPGLEHTFYPPGMEEVPKRFAIVKANRYMVDHADYLIAYVHHPASNAKKLLEYAQRREKKGFIRVTVL